MKTLLIVESPAKSKTIEKLLGSNYTVLASFGHIRNLDKKSLGIDVNDNFKPNYRILSDRSKQIKAIQEAIKKVDRVLLASDEDREGEAIAWHCAIVFKLGTTSAIRICFHEITKTALENAVANPRLINMQMVFSQQARRILDRLVGFKLSPLLWKYIAPKLSAGRVQSVALKLLVEHEKDIDKGTQNKFYKTVGIFSKNINGTLSTPFETADMAKGFLNDCRSASFIIKSIDKKRVEKRPPAPYTTSTIQQDAGTRFGIGAKNIMSILQKLYENGLITYHRTDSTNLSTLIQDEIKKMVTESYGKEYLHPRTYKSKIKCAQEAHEAIRPTHIDCQILDDSHDEFEKKIYNIIWKRTVASQMSACLSDVFTITITISNRKEVFIGRAEKIIFDGYKKIYEDIKTDDAEDTGDAGDSFEFIEGSIVENEKLNYSKITSTEKYNNLPLRYTESTLIKKMEKIGIGRPSTYSNIIETITDKKYVVKKDIKGKKVEIEIFTLEKDVIKTKKSNIVIGEEKKRLIPTDLGKSTITFLEENFNDILDYNFTSNLEEQLDNVANSVAQWDDVVREFYNKFEPNIVSLNAKSAKGLKDANKRLVGQNDDGKNVYSYIGKFGPLIQIGDDNDKRYIKLDDKYSINTVSIKDLNDILRYPKILGQYEGKDIIIKNGQYGYYIVYNEKNYKLMEGYDESLSLEDAIKIIGNKYIVRTGKYGPYITFEGKFYKIPKEYDISKMTDEDYKAIINKTS